MGVGKAVLVGLAMLGASAAAADPIVGEWRTLDGTLADIGMCGGEVCIVLKTGDWPGRKIGTLKASVPGRYSGSITDPRDGRTYSGRATLSGDTLKLTGCALKIFCQTETWSRN